MANRTVSLFIDDTSLRLMVTQGSQIKEWAEAPLEPGIIENAVVVQEEEFTEKVKQLFKTQNVKTKKILVGLSGLHCLTRPIALPQLPKEMVDEAVRREAARALPVPLEELYMSWQIIPAPESETQVFMVAIPRKAADTLIKALQQAGLKPTYLTLKPLLLTRAVSEPAAIIVDVQAMEFDIVVTTEGVPQPVRSISFGEDSLSIEEKLDTIKNELNRTISFFNSNNPEKAVESTAPIFVSGELANEPELCQSMSDELQHPVLILPTLLECPEGFDQTNFMTNISLAYQDTDPKVEEGVTVITLNALPAPYLPKPISLGNVLALPAAAILLLALASLFLLSQNTSSDVVSLTTDLTNTQQQLLQRQNQHGELTATVADLQTQIFQAEVAYNGSTAALTALEEQSAATNGDLQQAIIRLPRTVTLSSITHITSILTISGLATAEEEVLSYITELDKTDRFGDITITDMTNTGPDEFSFTLVTTLEMQRIGVSSLEVALGTLPSTVNLTGVTTQEGILNISGIAPGETIIFSYLRRLEAAEQFDEIIIANMARTATGDTDFSLILKAEDIEETPETGETAETGE